MNDLDTGGALLPFGRELGPSEASRCLQGDVAPLRALVRAHGAVILRDVARCIPDAASLAALGARWGQVMPWPFGPVLKVEERAVPRDLVFDHAHMPLHWDGSYREAMPEFMMLYCHRAASRGGRTLLVDTRRVIRQADAATLDTWRAISVTYLKGGRVHYSGAAHSPLVVKHPVTGEDVLRFEGPFPHAHPLVNPPERIWHGIAEQGITRTEADLATRLLDPNCCLAHRWSEGDLVIGDNFALLHGRESFEAGSARSLWRVQIHADPLVLNPAVPALSVRPEARSCRLRPPGIRPLRVDDERRGS